MELRSICVFTTIALIRVDSVFPPSCFIFTKFNYSVRRNNQMKKYVEFEMDLITFVAQDIVTFSAFGGIEDDLTEEENGVNTDAGDF